MSLAQIKSALTVSSEAEPQVSESIASLAEMIAKVVKQEVINFLQKGNGSGGHEMSTKEELLAKLTAFQQGKWDERSS